MNDIERAQYLRDYWKVRMKEREEEFKQAKVYYEHWCSELAKRLNKDKSDERNI